MSSLENILSLESWGFFKQNPVLIAGPCSAESEEQVEQTFSEIIAQVPETNLFRAGIWKPRTRPNSFEGVGAIGLPWVKKAAQKCKRPVSIEIANAEHVELALRNDIDVLWIGARSTVSPFIVQEIAEALRGTDIPVFVKNPVNPDLELWLGAVERLTEVGLKKVAVIHRGFSTYEKSSYRNPPMWEIPIELRRRHPNIPIIVDPSHIGGSRMLIQPLAQQAYDMGFDGLMIETHIHPDKAWSDAKQQVTPQMLKEIIQTLVVKNKLVESLQNDKLQSLRAKIDVIDDKILDMLSERMSVSEAIGMLKREKGLAIHQSERWSKIVNQALQKGLQGGLTEDFILKFFQQIHNESIYHQTKKDE